MGTQLVLFTTGSPKLWAYETWGDKGYHQNGGMGGRGSLQRMARDWVLGS